MFKKCKKCGTVVHVLKDNGDLMCCGEEMVELIPNNTDAVFEKHVPEYTIDGDKIIVTVNHVMESEHYIEWIALENNKELFMRKLDIEDEPKAIFNYIPNAVIYSYCNKHDLWKRKVKE